MRVSVQYRKISRETDQKDGLSLVRIWKRDMFRFGIGLGLFLFLVLILISVPVRILAPDKSYCLRKATGMGVQ